MKIAVIGSREFDNYDLMCEHLDSLIAQTLHGDGKVSLLSGGAPGADSLAEVYAMQRDLEIEVIEADWDDLTQPDALIKTNRWGKKYDANAGKRRNTEIVRKADLVVAFHNGSPGTADSLAKARLMGKKIIEVCFD
ncbi:MAG: DUF2493 domain-containing protein [Leptolyngbyaceae cyanobacterium RM2_2_4]|nr:DUF2493 domain-containing protein [Leptolyngbyaceae cyanobacterium RM2_2_4]